MTREELLKRYSIPEKIMDKYEKFCQCKVFDDDDVKVMSMIITLYDIGFSDEETEKYIRLSRSSPESVSERMNMLEEKRKSTLSDIHLKQKQLDGIDYLRYKILNNQL